MLKHKCHFNLFLRNFSHLIHLYLYSFSFIEPNIRQPKLASFNKGNKYKPAQFIDYLIIFLYIVSNLLTNLDQYLLRLYQFLLIAI